jgi:hypothetical protein
MFNVDWQNPETLWLNLTNLGLGLVLLGCVAAIAYGVVREWAARRHTATAMDNELRQMLASTNVTHVFRSPELGLTMADGGEPETGKEPERRKK